MIMRKCLEFLPISSEGGIVFNPISGSLNKILIMTTAFAAHSKKTIYVTKKRYFQMYRKQAS